LHNEKVHNLYSAKNIIGVTKSRRMRWAEITAHMGEIRNSYKILFGKYEGKCPLPDLHKGFRIPPPPKTSALKMATAMLIEKFENLQHSTWLIPENNYETSASFHQTTRHNIPDDNLLHTRRLENLKSQPRAGIQTHDLSKIKQECQTLRLHIRLVCTWWLLVTHLWQCSK
jgi:hypothetical protein